MSLEEYLDDNSANKNIYQQYRDQEDPQEELKLKKKIEDSLREKEKLEKLKKLYQEASQILTTTPTFESYFENESK